VVGFTGGIVIRFGGDILFYFFFVLRGAYTGSTILTHFLFIMPFRIDIVAKIITNSFIIKYK
jgi:hypothetical protein